MSVTLRISPATSLRLSTHDAAFLAGSARSGREMSFPRRVPCKATAAMTARRSGSLYEILRLTTKASPAEIKAAYRSLAKVYHPDSSNGGGGGGDFMAIHNAYATLSDPTARAVYDMSLLGVGSGVRRVGYGSGFYQTRRWETDQCW